MAALGLLTVSLLRSITFSVLSCCRL